MTKVAFLLVALLLSACGGNSGGGSGGNSTKLSWEAPNSRVDGTCAAASELGGFIVSYGASGIDENTYTIPVNAAGCIILSATPTQCGPVLSCSYELIGVSSGYFAMQAFDLAGLVSPYSNIVQK